ncbi:putative shugoshin C terminus [Lyophyllum shimeji]|uniref:Shugoshin C terminus n=1 Tax=Lyophyllum shimeji TaxID=47721 RepID=A0A9P3PGT6_LYOSH|nr:putative shugoshin C terminus [Lyophyllum shimeji]
MSRRESRTSINVRQNDALFEFENFKKKFLLANKHITKLNSTLSVRIEELNAQISTLYVENLRLRASEIALTAQLKREREKSRKVMAEAEAATLGLTKHLAYLRQTFNISTLSPAPPSPSSPRARKPPSNPNPSPNSPQLNRIARPPNIPGIYEEDEPCPSSSEHELEKPPSPVLKRTKAKARLSASRLPLPSRVSTPPPPLPQEVGIPRTELESAPTTKSRKPSRRQSGLLSVDTESLSVPRAPSPAFGSPIRRAAGLAEEEEEMAVVAGQLELDDMAEEHVDVRPPAKKERRKSRGKEREAADEQRESGVEGALPRERKRTRVKEEEDTDALIPIDNTVHDQADPGAPSSSRAFRGASPTPPTSRSSSSPAPPAGDGDGTTGGRERRARKSVNYAEPKLNTKMRKPDPAPGIAAPKKRASAAAVMTTNTYDNGNEADNDTEARSSLELPLRVNGNTINPESFPLPPSRPTSSAALFSSPPITRTTSSSSSSSAAASLKRKKSRPIVLDDDESDGAQADAEYVPPGGGSSGWVNIEGRRRATGGSKRSMAAVDDARRHSMAV